MYLDTKDYESSYNALVQYLKRAHPSYDKENPLSLVGTFLDTNGLLGYPYTISHPYAKFIEENGSLTVTLEMKPEVSSYEQLDTYSTFLEYAGIGGIVDLKEQAQGTERVPESNMDMFLNQKSATSPIQDYELELFFTPSDTVKKRNFTIRGVTYTQVEATVNVDLLEDSYTQTLYLLFKDRTSSAENFFSEHVGETLTKTDTLKVIDLVAERNITGYFVGGVEIRGTKTVTTLYASDNLEVEVHEGIVSAMNGYGTVNFSKESMKDSFIKRQGDSGYILVINLGREQLTVMFG